MTSKKPAVSDDFEQPLTIEDRLGSASCVVVGYDGTGAGLQALRWALEETAPQEQIVVVSSLRRERALPLPELRDTRAVRARLEALWAEDGDVLDDEVELVIDDGAPAPTLARMAQERRARLIVVGHHRRGRLGVLYASVARDLLEISPVPVCVVP